MKTTEEAGEMNCKLCGGNDVKITYKGKIRNGAPGRYTDREIPVFLCGACGCVWHEPIVESQAFYESDMYRASMGESVDLDSFHSRHDAEVLDKLNYTGTAIYRSKVFMDVGCGGGVLRISSGASRRE
jgi:hypothetical protein